MRIGEFAKLNKVSIDTVRHYMDMGLVFPVKRSGQYWFGEHNHTEIQEVLSLKNMGFKLGEIRTVILFNRLGSLTGFQKNEYYRTIFDTKFLELKDEILELNRMKDNLGDKIKELDCCKDDKQFTLGVGLAQLQVLRCHQCGGELSMVDGKIESDQIVSGTLSCKCGVSYGIKEGIVMVEDDLIEDETVFNHSYIGNYIRMTDSKYVENIYKEIEWGISKLDFDSFGGKLMLELGSGVGFMLRNMYHLLPDDATYIALDHDIGRHRFLKSMLERADVRKNIIFVCADFKKIPIAKGSVDVVLDFSGTSNYSFEHESFLLNEVDDYVKDKACLLGMYIMFNNFAMDSLIEEKYRHNFVLEQVKASIIGLGYKEQGENISAPLEKGGKYEDFFVSGEKVYTYSFIGERG